MNHLSLSSAIAALLLAFGPLPAAYAQEVRFLRADTLELSSPQELDLHFGVATDGAWSRSAWPAGFDWVLVRVGGAQQNLEGLRPAREDEPSVALRLSEPGITLIAADLAPRVESVPAAELAAFLSTRVGAATLPPEWREMLGREKLVGETLRVRRVESTKLLVRVLGPKGFLPQSATAQSKTGQAVEIRPLADPTSAPIKSDLPLRIYLPNPARKGTKVIATHLESGRTQSFLTDPVSSGYFTITVSGVWSVEAHHARPLTGDPQADWEICTATMTFEVPHWDPRQGEER